jgi:hypothetical protein
VLLYRLVSLGLQTAVGAIALATLIPALRTPRPATGDVAG